MPSSPIRKRDWKLLNKNLQMRMDNIETKDIDDELIMAGLVLRHESFRPVKLK
jgi:hypothetical protein